VNYSQSGLLDVAVACFQKFQHASAAFLSRPQLCFRFALQLHITELYLITNVLSNGTYFKLVYRTFVSGPGRSAAILHVG